VPPRLNTLFRILIVLSLEIVVATVEAEHKLSLAGAGILSKAERVLQSS
jgi:hypothetical protein